MCLVAKHSYLILPIASISAAKKLMSFRTFAISRICLRAIYAFSSRHIRAWNAFHLIFPSHYHCHARKMKIKSNKSHTTIKHTTQKKLHTILASFLMHYYLSLSHFILCLFIISVDMTIILNSISKSLSYSSPQRESLNR